MKNSNPFIPGSLLDQKNKARARARLAVFCSLAVSAVVLMILLMQGCRRGGTTSENPDTNTVVTPPVEPTPPPGSTNPPVTPPVAPTVVAPTPPAAVGQDYKVVKGDTFSSIAKKFGVSVKAIEAANPGVEPTKLIADKTVLHIPAPAASTAPSTGNATAAPGGNGSEQTYTVQSGDNLTKLATRFGTSVKAIQAANNLGSSTSIKVGQILKIPAKAAAPADNSPMSAPPATPPPPATAPPATPPPPAK